MADAPKTSFIPKQSMGNVPGRVTRRRRHFNVFSFIGMVVFLCGIILSIGVLVYKDLSEKELASKKAELQESKDKFSQSDIESLRELDRRINVAQVLLDEHLAPTVVFDMLEQRTQEDIQFNEFSYTRRESGSVEVVLNGTALRFNTVALQGQQFADARTLTSAIFSDLSVDDEENITFTVTGQANAELLQYTAAPLSDDGGDAATSTTDTTEDTISDTESLDDTEEGTTIEDDMPANAQ